MTRLTGADAVLTLLLPVRQILAILRKKDEKMEELREEAEKQAQALEGYRLRQEQLEQQLQRARAANAEPPSILKRPGADGARNDASHRELLALREKAADQSEQLQVLLEELQRAKAGRKDFDQQLALAQASEAHLKREVDKLQRSTFPRALRCL